MAVARAGLDHRDGRIFDHRADQPLAAARDQHIQVAVQVHQVVGRVAAGIGHKQDTVVGEPGAPERTAHDLCKRCIGVDRFLAAPQDTNVGGFEAEARRIDCDIGARFKDHPDHPNRGAHLLDFQPVWTGAAIYDLPNRVRQADQVTHRPGDPLNTGRGQPQAVLQ